MSRPELIGGKWQRLLGTWSDCDSNANCPDACDKSTEGIARYPTGPPSSGHSATAGSTVPAQKQSTSRASSGDSRSTGTDCSPPQQRQDGTPTASLSAKPAAAAGAIPPHPPQEKNGHNSTSAVMTTVEDRRKSMKTKPSRVFPASYGAIAGWSRSVLALSRATHESEPRPLGSGRSHVPGTL